MTALRRLHARDAVLADAEHVLDDVRREDAQVLGRPRGVDHDLRRAELVAAVHEHDLGGEAREERRLLHRRVAAADDDHALVAEERGVADGAVADAAALQRALAGQAELARRGAGRDDDRAGAVLLLADVDLVRRLGEVDVGDVVGDELRAEALGLRAHLAHQLRAEDAVAEAGVVVDVGGDHELAAGLEALDAERLQVRAGGVQGRRVAGGAAADDDDVAQVAHGFLLRSGRVTDVPRRYHRFERYRSSRCSRPNPSRPAVRSRGHGPVFASGLAADDGGRRRAHVRARRRAALRGRHRRRQEPRLPDPGGDRGPHGRDLDRDACAAVAAAARRPAAGGGCARPHDRRGGAEGPRQLHLPARRERRRAAPDRPRPPRGARAPAPVAREHRRPATAPSSTSRRRAASGRSSPSGADRCRGGRCPVLDLLLRARPGARRRGRDRVRQPRPVLRRPRAADRLRRPRSACCPSTTWSSSTRRTSSRTSRPSGSARASASPT